MKRIMLMVVTAVCLISCQNQKSQVREESEEVLGKVGRGKYGIETGVVEYKTKMMGMDAIQKLYFVGYGEKESTVTDIEMMGMKLKSVTVTKDGMMYNYDPQQRTGSKTSMNSKSNIDFENLTEQVMEDMKIRKVGEERMLGRKCIKYSIDNASLKMKGYYWVWKGIPLKTDVDMGSMKMVLEAISVQENVSIPDNQFDIPGDIRFE
jgi:hypothetical protein